MCYCDPLLHQEMQVKPLGYFEVSVVAGFLLFEFLGFLGAMIQFGD